MRIHNPVQEDMMRCALEAEAQLRCVAARTVLKAASADKAAKSAAGKFLLRCNIVLFSVYCFWRARVCCPLHCLCRPFCIFLRDVWIRNQRAAVASRRATKLATHLPNTLFFGVSIYVIFNLVDSTSVIEILVQT
jgi:hypothetical protein